MTSWTLRQLTRGTGEGRFHAHSYYDIAVFDHASRRLAVHRMSFAGRALCPEDAVEVGWIDIAEDPPAFRVLGESRAWSWQQGPHAQWVPGRPEMVWSDRDGDRFVARLANVETGERRTLPRPVYALSPDGRTALSLNMARLDGMRPGYGYPGGAGARLDRRAPGTDGVWAMDLATGADRLILPLSRAVRFAVPRLPPREILRHLRHRYTYWFNHAKISPSGTRFTVKLRWRVPGGGWNETMGASLTCGMDGGDLALLARGTSHVIWSDARHLFMWRDGRLRFYEDARPGRQTGEVPPEVIDANVHMRATPGDPGSFVFDTPYREDVALRLCRAGDWSAETIARFSGHVPATGPFRCDLHPCPSPDGRHIAVTSMQDGGRQLYLLSRAG